MALREIDFAQVKRTGEHFKKILRDLFQAIPPKSRSIAGLARWTGINKSSCQRLVQALSKTTDGIDVVVTLPGPSSLEQFNQKFKKLMNESDCLQDFESMAQEYQNLIFSYATSQSELKKMLLQSVSEGSVNREQYIKKLRKQAYESNKELTGESVELYLGIHVIRENKDDPEFIDEMLIANRVGVELAKNARPFVQPFAGNQPGLIVGAPVSIDRTNFSKAQNSGFNAYLLKDFSTPGIEHCFAGVGSLKNSLIYNHTLEPIDSRKFDITTALQELKTQKSPLYGGPNILCQSLMQRSPAKKIVLLVLMQKRLEQRSAVQGGCYPSSLRAQEAGHNAEDLWNDKFSDSPEIKLFNPDMEDLSGKTGIYNLDKLLGESMYYMNQDPSDYVGYYLEVDYPLWLTCQRFYFDFSEID